MKKILLVIPSLKRGGGAERVASLLSHGLTEAGAKVSLLTFYDESDEYPTDAFRSCLEENPSGIKILKLFSRTRAIASYCRRHKIEAVFSFMEEANFPSLLSRLFHNPAAIIVSVRQDPSVYGPAYRRLIRRLYPLAHQVVAVSRQMQADLEHDFGLNNVSTIYNPIDIQQVSQRLAEKLPSHQPALFQNRFTFITIGRLARQKGQWHLIRAFAEATKRHPKAQLLILGEGELRPFLSNLIHDLKLSHSVHLLGNQENTYPFLAASQCFLLPSLWEGFPNTLIEALAAGLPAIAADCPTGPREILAPECELDSSLAYPYHGKYGVLLSPFALQGEPLTAKDPLLENEKQLADLLTQILKQPSQWQRNRKASPAVQSLRLATISHAWLNLTEHVRH